MSSPNDIQNRVGLKGSIIGPQTPGPSHADRFKSWLKATAASTEKLSFLLAAHDDPELIAKLKPYERNFAKLRGVGQVLDLGVKTAGMTMLLDYVSGSGFSAGNLAMAALLAAYLGLVDHFTFVRAPLVETGLRAMADAGLKLELPSVNEKSTRRAKLLRVSVSVLTGVVLAFVIGLAYDRDAIVQQEQLDWIANNRSSYDQAVRDYNAKEKYFEEAYREHFASAHSKRRMSAQLRAKLNAELAKSQSDLDTLRTGRGQVLDGWIKSQPGFIPKDDSFIGRIKAFIEVIRANPLAGVPILALDVLALALDLMTAMLSLVRIPSLYAAETVRRHLEAIVQTARLAAANLTPVEQRGLPTGDRTDDEPDRRPPTSPAAGGAKTPSPPWPPITAANGAAIPHRGPGRPRKPKPPASDEPRAA